jgi:F-type H+-transporting ATPase subunit gamma
MQTIEGLKRKIRSTEDLQSVVKTMKALAAVSIRQYERAVESLEDYSEAVEKGLHIVLRSRSDRMVGARPAPAGRLGAVIFGSDQGMCGQLNDQIADHALNAMEKQLDISKDHRSILAVGHRVSGRLEDEGQPVEETLSMPSSISGITPSVQEILFRIEGWNARRDLDQVFLFYSKQLSGATYRPNTVHLLPVDRQWLERLREEEWPTSQLPAFTMEWDRLFSSLIRQYLFISLYRAFAESLASENASRLASMQGAERNIQELLGDLNQQFHQRRQMSITEELLDIVSGFEALKE